MRGALLAIDELNAQGGVLGRPVRLESRDTASRPEKAVKNVNSLADQGDYEDNSLRFPTGLDARRRGAWNH